ncbi:alpha/beta hydrolase [Porphyrobacter sp. TH134]|uniref:alpha/beta fold hydrolase n=1 Tax=Porphyrobacter sp. TH134 TaxID=2067450 RepID=UPI000C7D3C23|nr:alpha/beta hydrolase [Porphyrobacter sp. TH134]PLK24102.1 alpha/beta hydrolase [Porphyrobacter sp. TH134]
MPTVTTPNTGIEIFYEDTAPLGGDPAAEVILLVMGLGAQMTLWPDELVAALVGDGFRVIRYDNRDIGLSQKMEGQRAPSLPVQLLRKKIGFPAKVPYTLKDMADDGIGLLDALGIARAHVVGASMGGMIAQLMAVHHGDRLASLTSIMSTTGNGKLPQAEKHAMDALVAPITSMEEESLVAHGLNVAKNIGSPGYPFDPEAQRARVLANIRRSVYPAGLPRQLAAIIDDGCRRSRLAQVSVPTLVMHGEADPLVKLEAGEDTAAHISGARLVTIPGWGHDLPVALIPRIAGEIAAHARGGG